MFFLKLKHLALALVAIAVLLANSQARAAPLLVFAAASLKDALDQVEAAYEAKGGARTTISYAASGPLAKQIENGAPADLFISADLDWMDYVQGKGLIRPDTRVNLLGNRLVLVAPADSTVKIDIGTGFPLAQMLGSSNRLAIGNPASVPAGKYAQQALQKLGVWEQVKYRTANADSVRSALALVSRGETPLGIVYETDAFADKGVRVVGTFPEDSHPPIIYPVAVTAESKNPEAAKFLDFLRSAQATPYFQKQGFTLLKR